MSRGEVCQALKGRRAWQLPSPLYSHSPQDDEHEGKRETGCSECRDVPSPPHPGEAEWRMVSLGGWSQEPQCRVRVCPCTRAPPQVVCLGGWI